MQLSSNDLAAKTLHSYVTQLELLYAFCIHTRSSSPHGTDHVSQLVQKAYLAEQISQAVNIFDDVTVGLSHFTECEVLNASSTSTSSVYH